MTNEELVELYQAGYEKVLEDLLLQNEGFVRKVMKKFYIGWDPAVSQEDLVQEGYIGLMVAAQKFDTEVGKFTTYAYHWVFQTMHRFLFPKRSTLNRAKEGLYDKSLNEKIGDDLELQDMLCDNQYLYTEMIQLLPDEDSEVLKLIQEKLGEDASKLVRYRFGFEDNIQRDDYTVAMRCGMSVDDCKKLYKEIISELRRSEWCKEKKRARKNQIKEKIYDTGRVTEKFLDCIMDDID